MLSNLTQDLPQHVFGHDHLLDPCRGAEPSAVCMHLIAFVHPCKKHHCVFIVLVRVEAKQSNSLAQKTLKDCEVWSFMTVAIPELIDLGLAFEAS